MDFAKAPPGGFPYLTWPRLDSALRSAGGRAGVTTRRGGVSAPPFNSANLGLSTGDDPAAVRENRHRLCAALDLPPGAFQEVRQVHGTRIIRADGPLPPPPPEADGLITNRPGLLLAVFTADCIPLILFDPRRRAAAALHAGWRGTAAGILGRGIQRMGKEFGTRAEDLLLAIGPGISGTRYEVGPEVAEALAGSLTAPRREQWFFPEARGADVARVNYLQALEHGLSPGSVETAPAELDTLARPDLFFSHRRDGKNAGRQAGFIVL